MRFATLLLIGCLLTSCATITRGRHEIISVDSDPSGATATILCAGNVSATGTTPARLTIPRNAELCRVDVEKSGMKAQKIQLTRGFNFSYWMNTIPALGIPLGLYYALDTLSILGPARSPTAPIVAFYIGVGGAAGFAVDRVTGAMYDHNPKVIRVTLQPAQ